MEGGSEAAGTHLSGAYPRPGGRGSTREDFPGGEVSEPGPGEL